MNQLDTTHQSPGHILEREPVLEPQGSTAISSAHGAFEFDDVFEAHSSRVWRTLRSLGVHEAWLDDALQDVFIIIHKKLPSFVERAQLSTWIYAVTYRVAQNFRRRIQKTTHNELHEDIPSTSSSPEDLMVYREYANFVRFFCEKLSEVKRDVFVLCLMEERNVPEVAQLLGVNLNTVYSRLRLVKADFRLALARQARKESK